MGSEWHPETEKRFREGVAAEQQRIDAEVRNKAKEQLHGDVESSTVTSIDPWAHRSVHMRCKTCMWFAPKQDEIGRCRRHAPTMGGYPVVFITDWCGDHKLDENRR